MAEPLSLFNSGAQVGRWGGGASTEQESKEQSFFKVGVKHWTQCLSYKKINLIS